MRWLPRSLHARMLALSAAATLLALVAAGWMIASMLERLVVAGLDRRLDSEVALLATAVGGDGTIDRVRLQSVMGALEPGRGWRWRIAGSRATIGSADFPRLDDGPLHHLPMPPGASGAEANSPRDDGLRPIDGATEDGVAVHARRLLLNTATGPVVITAAAPRDVIKRPIRDAVAPLLGLLATLGGLLAVATMLQLRLGLRPLRRLRDQIVAIRAGKRDALDEDQPSELRPLVVELNALARDNAAALATARLSAANLAHALKTPVAALALDLRDDPARLAQIDRIDGTIRHHLSRARIAAVDRRSSTPLAPALDDLASTVRRLYAAKSLEISLQVEDELRVAVDPRDFDELVGNLIDNAVKNARSRVTIDARRTLPGRDVAILVCDDGAGIPAAARAHVRMPGVRLDEQVEGHGFGLSIAFDLAALYGGALTLSDHDGGGLCAEVTLPSS